MKRFLVVLLSLGLIMAFSMPAFAVDVKFSGSYYAQGWYVDNFELKENNDSRAFINQRLRLQTVLQIADGLSFTTRFDALEKKWGNQRWKGGFDDSRNRLSTGAANTREQENIEFERAYVTFATKVGQFDVGYQQGSSAFGTGFLDSYESIGRIKYTIPCGPHALVLSYEKFNEYMGDPNGPTKIQGDSNKDADDNAYAVAGITKFQGGEAGLIYKYIDLAGKKPEPGPGGVTTPPYGSGYRSTLHVVNPYLKKTAGPLNVEAEAYYIGGKAAEFDTPGLPDVDAESYGGYVKAQMDRGPAYAGAMLIYMRGDDPSSTDEKEGGFMPALYWGEAFNPNLIFWNLDYFQWVGATTGPCMDNAQYVQVYGGFKPNPKLHLKASISYAKADEKPAGYVDDEYGTEVDVTASYKIYNNLEYMVGAAYLFAGDYFKGTSSSKKIDDNYLLTHKLTLTF